MADLYGFRKNTAQTLLGMANGVHGRTARTVQTGSETDNGTIKLGRVTSEIAAATDGQLVSGSVTIALFDPSSSPATMSTSGMNTITAWNPHDDAIPADTYVILARSPNGWVIVLPLNYCP